VLSVPVVARTMRGRASAPVTRLMAGARTSFVEVSVVDGLAHNAASPQEMTAPLPRGTDGSIRVTRRLNQTGLEAVSPL